MKAMARCEGIGLIVFLLMATLLCGCGIQPGIGYGIPGTPISVGASLPPLGEERAGKVVYRQARVESNPTGAQVLLNGRLVGSTPMDISVPFAKGFWGGAKGTAQLVVQKPGHLPEGRQLFPAARGRVSEIPDGPPVGRFIFTLRRE